MNRNKVAIYHCSSAKIGSHKSVSPIVKDSATDYFETFSCTLQSYRLGETSMRHNFSKETYKRERNATDMNQKRLLPHTV